MEPLCILLLLLCKICEVLNVVKSLDIIQETGIRTAKVGETVTLHCSCQHNAITYLFWYHQSLGGKPNIISKRMKHSTEILISPAYENRFQVVARPKEGVNDLIITDLQPMDSGTYYCVILEFNAIEFGEGIFLHVKIPSLNTQMSIHQPALKRLRLGASVNLSCTVSSENSGGHQSIYWFRRTASQPGLMYTRERRCAGLSDGTLYGINCTSNLKLYPVRSSDAGTYYCALASRGAVVFGEGTKVEILAPPPLLVYCLSVALILSIIGLLVLSFLRFKLKSKMCKGTGNHILCSEALNATQGTTTESLHYAALYLKRGQRQEENVESACVYSRVRSRKE